MKEIPWKPDLYYLHGDHLGTVTFVTNSHAEATQFFLNLPFGETMLEQTDESYDNPFKFNAKELDDDTGLYYYGARYYNPRLSIWYGVDPLAVYSLVMETEFYGDGQHNGGVFFWGNLNPYIYTYQNPIRYIDPNGKQVDVTDGNTKDIQGVSIPGFSKKFKSDFRKIHRPGNNRVYLIDQLKPKRGQLPYAARRYKIKLLFQGGNEESNNSLFYIYNKGPWNNTQTDGPYKGSYIIGGDLYSISSSTNSTESNSGLLSDIGASLKNTPDMSVSITGMMTNDSSDTTASNLALKKSEEIRDALINFGASQNQITIGSPIGNQSENSTQIKTNSTFNVPNLPINKSQINNLNQ